jgi:hypothetical protein
MVEFHLLYAEPTLTEEYPDQVGALAKVSMKAH